MLSKLRSSASALLQASTFLGLALIAFVWATLYVDNARRREAQVQDAKSEALSLVRLLEKSANGLLKELDRIALYVRDFVEREQGSESFNDMVARTRIMSDLTLQIAIADATGLCWATTVQPAPSKPTSIADRPHFKIQKERFFDAPYVSVPVLGRISQRWSVQLTRRIDMPDGQFGGVVVVSLDPAQLANFFGSLEAADGYQFALVGLDGVVRSSGGRNPYELGSDLSKSALLDRARAETEDVFFDRPADGAPGELVAFRALTDFPLFVTVSKREAEVLALSSSSGVAAAMGVTLIALLTIILSARHKHTLSQARAALAASKRRAIKKAHELELTLEHMNQGILMVDSDRKVVVINRQAVDLLGVPERYMQPGASYEDIVEVLRDQEMRAGDSSTPTHSLARALQVAQGGRVPPHLEHEGSDGTVLEISSTALEEGGFVRTITDITKRRRSEDRIQHMANHDPLTDLANRVLFRKRLDAALAEVDRGSRFAILLLDLDQFKDVNDSLGHPFGDELLKVVAARLRSSLRSDDLVARIGGDEFVVIQRNAATPEACSSLARTLVHTISAPYTIENQTVVIGVSIGIAMVPAHGRDGDELLKAADMALYRAKAEGRGRFCFFTSQLSERVQRRRKLEVDLRAALERNEFEIHYQPVLANGGSEIASFEALMRWRHPVRDIVGPDEFIPVAEDLGLIVQMGEWVLREACKEAATWPEGLQLAVNLSPLQFNSGALKNAILSAIAQSGLKPERLLLEITETTLLRHSPTTLSLLHELRELGVSIALDDFGTGYSSLSYLQSMPFDALKIDRRFVKGLGTVNNTEPLVRAMIDVANALGMSTTAEGVETRAQLNRLKALGCKEFQGFLFGMPCPAKELPAVMARFAVASPERDRPRRATAGRLKRAGGRPARTNASGR